MIRNDGTIERGRPIQQEGAHAATNGHNKYSIGVALVGGYTTNSNSGLANTPYGPASISPEQLNTLKFFMTNFYKVWPGGQAWSHRETDPQRAPDPGFDLSNYVKSHFSKINVSESGTSPPLNSAEIALELQKEST